MWHKIWAVFYSSEQRFLLLRLLVIYLIIAVPFKTLEILPGFANIRPNSAFVPVYGILYGPVGAWANALGNLGYDVFTGSFAKSSFAGMFANFAVPLFMSWFWKILTHRAFAIVTIIDLSMYTVVVLAGAILKTLIITPAVIYFYPEMSGRAFAEAVFYTETVFYLMPGTALLIFLQCAYGLGEYKAQN